MSSSTLPTFGRALNPAERRAVRFGDALAAFRLHTGLRMDGDDAAAKAAAEKAAAEKKAADEKAAADKAAAEKKAAEDKAAAEKKGYPANTKPEDMKPEEQAAYYREQARKHEDRNKAMLALTGNKYGDDLKADLDELANLRKEKLTDQEKAVADAEEAAQTKVRAEFAPKLASMAFDVALAHVPEDDRAKLIDSIDLSKFVDPATGDVDTDKVKDTAELLAPKPGKGTPGRPDYGGGRRTGTETTGVESGRARYEERHGKKKPADA